MNRLALALPLLLAACNNDPGLTVRGNVTAVADDGTTRAYSFPQDTRLDAPEGTTGRFTGECRVLRTFGADTSEQWAIALAVNSGGTTDDAFPLSAVRVMQTSGLAPEAGQVELDLGGSTYASGSTGCNVTVEYVNGPEGLVGLTSECDVTNPEASGAHVSLQLDVVGCEVER